MILDSCKNWKTYAYGKETVWAAAFNFLSDLSLDWEDGKYEIMGEDMFAIVQSYDTKDISEGKVEAHRKFIDIQTLLAGNERIFYGNADGLVINEEYVDENDVLFYEKDDDKLVELKIAPGDFAMFFPEEGHMPCIASKAGIGSVKKVVIKIAVELLA